MELEQGQASSDRIRFRIGINVGDIIADGDDIAGDGVNIAARLEALAPVDGICVSSMVREQIRDDLGFTDMGEQKLKNIARPIRTWAWRPDAAAPAPALSPPLDKPPAKPVRLSIVVLPFTNVSGDPAQEYFFRRHHRRGDGATVQDQGQLCDRPGHCDQVQGQGDRYPRSGRRTRRALRAQGKRRALRSGHRYHGPAVGHAVRNGVVGRYDGGRQGGGAQHQARSGQPSCDCAEPPAHRGRGQAFREFRKP